MCKGISELKIIKMYTRLKTVMALMGAIVILGACSSTPDAVQPTETLEVAPTALPTLIPETDDESAEDPSTPVFEAASTEVPITVPNTTGFSLPQREGPQTITTGTVPHVQINVNPIEAVNDELVRRVFSIPGIEEMPTIISLPGAQGMWLREDIVLENPQVIVNGREFAHIHPDGSLHAVLPFERAVELTEKGWGERHPWADEREGWDGFVMFYTPQSMEELEVTFQLIVESYNYVTGDTLQASDFK